MDYPNFVRFFNIIYDRKYNRLIYSRYVSNHSRMSPMAWTLFEPKTDRDVSNQDTIWAATIYGPSITVSKVHRW